MGDKQQLTDWLTVLYTPNENEYCTWYFTVMLESTVLTVFETLFRKGNNNSSCAFVLRWRAMEFKFNLAGPRLLFFSLTNKSLKKNLLDLLSIHPPVRVVVVYLTFTDPTSNPAVVTRYKRN